jgi:hypothetical protein
MDGAEYSLKTSTKISIAVAVRIKRPAIMSHDKT